MNRYLSLAVLVVAAAIRLPGLHPNGLLLHDIEAASRLGQTNGSLLILAVFGIIVGELNLIFPRKP